jgi:hypothetical protein
MATCLPIGIKPPATQLALNNGLRHAETSLPLIASSLSRVAVRARIEIRKDPAIVSSPDIAACAGNSQPFVFSYSELDGAGWHRIGKRLVLPGNIALLHLPPYSPELNPSRTSGNSSDRTSSAGTQGALTEDLTSHSDEQSGEEYSSGAERSPLAPFR